MLYIYFNTPFALNATVLALEGVPNLGPVNSGIRLPEHHATLRSASCPALLPRWDRLTCLEYRCAVLRCAMMPLAMRGVAMRGAVLALCMVQTGSHSPHSISRGGAAELPLGWLRNCPAPHFECERSVRSIITEPHTPLVRLVDLGLAALVPVSCETSAGVPNIKVVPRFSPFFKTQPLRPLGPCRPMIVFPIAEILGVDIGHKALCPISRHKIRAYYD
eukprot:COSAG03_NODE_519_length_7216_cov_23.238724_2_plen_219_part_00